MEKRDKALKDYYRRHYTELQEQALLLIGGDSTYARVVLRQTYEYALTVIDSYPLAGSTLPWGTWLCDLMRQRVAMTTLIDQLCTTDAPLYQHALTLTSGNEQEAKALLQKVRTAAHFAIVLAWKQNVSISELEEWLLSLLVGQIDIDLFSKQYERKAQKDWLALVRYLEGKSKHVVESAEDRVNQLSLKYIARIRKFKKHKLYRPVEDIDAYMWKTMINAQKDAQEQFKEQRNIESLDAQNSREARIAETLKDTRLEAFVEEVEGENDREILLSLIKQDHSQAKKHKIMELYLHGIEQKEIAKQLQMKYNTVKSIVQRSIQEILASCPQPMLLDLLERSPQAKMQLYKLSGIIFEDALDKYMMHMYLIAGMDEHKIAEMTGEDIANVERRLKRCRKDLFKAFHKR